MNTILVWILVSIGGYNGNNVTYSPPMHELESCLRMQKTVKEFGAQLNTRCVQISIIK